MTTATRVVHLSRGIPPDEALPVEELALHTAAVLASHGARAFGYAHIGAFQGDAALREELGRLHDAGPDQIFVGNGSLQVLDLVARHLLRGGDDVFVEAPTYDRAIVIFERHGGRVWAVPVERDGLDLDALEQRLHTVVPTFLYTIPDFQNPSGVTLSESKRRALAALAVRYDFTIVEDTPYRALRYHGAAPPELAKLTGGARTIGLCSLSKVLSPGLRIGYAIADPATARALALAAENTYLSPPPLCQAVAERCLRAGVMTSNVEHLRALYGARHDAAVSAAQRLAGDALLAVPDGGFFLSVHLPSVLDETALLAAARANGIVLTAGSGFYAGSSRPPRGTVFVRLPFQALEPRDFADALARLVALGRGDAA